MIRINLLGVPKPKRGKRATVSLPTLGGEAPNMLVVALVLAAVVLGGNAFWWWSLNHEKARIAQEVQQAEQENRRLAEVKARYLERQKQAENYKRRVDVIDQLRANQSGPVNLLSMIGDTVNATDAVWLSNMTDEGRSVSIQGVALSANAVANLMANLKKSGYFKTVEIKETVQDDTVHDMQAFVFTLTCEKQKS
jgi:type IV pilus assembly protein PilN